jgi:hypothetical protein
MHFERVRFKHMSATEARDDAAQGFTLVELLAIVVLIGFVLAGVHLFGWLLGAVVGFIAFLFAGSALALVRDGFEGIPRLPRCRNGRCRGPGLLLGHGDYSIVKFGDEYNRVCRCGIRHRRSGKRFVIVNEDGTETPYLVWRPFRGWFPDQPGIGQPDGAANGSQPIRSGTNRTSSATGSDR